MEKEKKKTLNSEEKTYTEKKTKRKKQAYH